MLMALKVYNEKKVAFCRKTNISDYHHAMLDGATQGQGKVNASLRSLYIAADLGWKVEDIVQYAKEAFRPTICLR